MPITTWNILKIFDGPVAIAGVAAAVGDKEWEVELEDEVECVVVEVLLVAFVVECHVVVGFHEVEVVQCVLLFDVVGGAGPLPWNHQFTERTPGPREPAR